jgi:hypothetical protein
VESKVTWNIDIETCLLLILGPGYLELIAQYATDSFTISLQYNQMSLASIG